MIDSRKRRRKSEDSNAVRVDSAEEEEEVKVVCFGCCGEEAINYKRKSYIEALENLLSEKVLNCEEEAYKLYCDYAFAMGFSVRKGKQYYFEGTKRVRAKMYCCSKEGLAISEREGGNGGSNSCNNNKLETRTGCKAMIYFVCNKGEWKVGKFVKEHNHEMAEVCERPLLRSARAALASNYGGMQPKLSDMSSPCCEVEKPEDVIDLDSDEEDVMCLRCNGAEGEAEACECSSNTDVDDLEKILAEQVIQNEEEAYKVYCDYAHVMGFSVRKGKQYYFPGTKRIRSKSYYCSKEGCVNEDISVATHNKLDARTGCKAMICFTCDEGGQWKVTKFVKEHNHKMAEPYERHLLRSARSVSDAKGSTASQSMKLGLNNVTCSIECSGSESIGHENSIKEPHEGMMFETEDAARAFYGEYARDVGFVMDVMLSCPSVMEGSSIAHHSGCNEGDFCANKYNPLRLVVNQHPGSGARCQAMMTVKSDKSGNWVVTRFLRDHSHPLVIFPREVRYSMDDKDKKIQELTSELRNKRRLCTMYQEQLMLFMREVEEHINQLSRKTELSLQLSIEDCSYCLYI
ncbi:protein FAR1-RELATED SEQUENCE 7-like isoform X2 [Coffea eugenioides]|uniref:protein FAR1-RELATED SEQUENCE 7-like isoform X2 n=1 Tax=Coffea eugenioides TaxID=49369 RepID=UPI000F611BDB|nr:protein FAR1-RELATED SEQUENCE 7-like isoform X2 [Coffea eugenioides]